MANQKKKEKKIKKNTPFYRFCAWIVKIIYGKSVVEGLDNLPDEACVIVANHSQLHSPLTFELFFKVKRAIWCDGKMMDKKEVPQYAEDNFWPKASDKKKKQRRFWIKIIAPFVAYIFTRAHTLPVYRDARLMKTFRFSEESLLRGENLIIFPENEITDPENPILDFFNLHFVDIAKIYHKKYGKILTFVPVYNCVEQKKVVVGKDHVKYDPDIPMEEQRKLLCEKLRSEITKIAQSLPRHKVVPFLPLEEGEVRYSKEE